MEKKLKWGLTYQVWDLCVLCHSCEGTLKPGQFLQNTSVPCPQAEGRCSSTGWHNLHLKSKNRPWCFFKAFNKSECDCLWALKEYKEIYFWVLYILSVVYHIYSLKKKHKDIQSQNVCIDNFKHTLPSTYSMTMHRCLRVSNEQNIETTKGFSAKVRMSRSTNTCWIWFRSIRFCRLIFFMANRWRVSLWRTRNTALHGR